MKRYLLVGIALLFVSANASLKEDFAQMDLEEEQLLSDMRKSVALTGEEDDEEDDEEETVAPEKEVEPEKIEKEEVVPSSPEENSAKMAASLDAVTSESKSVDDEDDNVWMQSEVRQRAVEEAQKASDAEEEAKKLEAEIKKAKAEEAAKAQREAEKREVEAYEKQRAEKLAKEAAEKAELEQKQLAQKALEEEKEESVNVALDVNISRELEVKTQAADEEYENAIKEMNTEKLAKEAAEKVELEKTQLAQKALEEEKEEGANVALDINISRELEVKTQAADEEYGNAIKEMNEED